MMGYHNPPDPPLQRLEGRRFGKTEPAICDSLRVITENQWRLLMGGLADVYRPLPHVDDQENGPIRPNLCRRSLHQIKRTSSKMAAFFLVPGTDDVESGLVKLRSLTRHYATGLTPHSLNRFYLPKHAFT